MTRYADPFVNANDLFVFSFFFPSSSSFFSFFLFFQVCCHEVNAPEKKNNPCHIPWGQLEHLKVPHTWAKKHTACAKHVTMWPDPGPDMYCLKGAHSLTPQLHGEIYWMPWDARHSKTRDGHLVVKTKTFNCMDGWDFIFGVLFWF